mgnify:CR=1 FL=1
MPKEPHDIQRLFRRRKRESPIEACDEARGSGYDLCRQITACAVRCEVIVPALTPRRPGQRVETDRRDARNVFRLFRVRASAGPISPRVQGFLLALLGAALWGLAPTATKGALEVANPASLVALRLGVSAVLFRLLAGFPGPWVPRDRWTWIAGCALAADFLLYTYGIQHTEAAVGGLLVNVEPVATILLARWLLGEGFTRHRICGSLFTLSGVILVGAQGVDWQQLWAAGRLRGNAAVVASAVLWSVYAVSQRLSQAGATLWQRLAGIFQVAFLVSAPVTLPRCALSGSSAEGQWLFVAALVLFCTAGGYLVYARAQQLLDVSVLALLLTAIPVFNLAFASLFLGEAITLQLLLATALILAGVTAMALEPPRPIRARAEEH